MTRADRSAIVLAGGISHEREVSLRSGRRVADGLMEQGWSVDLREPDSSLLVALQTSPPVVIWPALHGASGEDGALRALLETTGIPFVGAAHSAARLAWDKPTAKALARRDGVATPRGFALSRDTFRELGAATVLSRVLEFFGLPLVVKPSRGGSAQGVTIVQHADALPRAMVDAYTYGDEILIEAYVDGIEIAIGVVDFGDGPVALPAVEIEPIHGVYGFEARYNAGETRFYAPARLSAEAANQSAEVARRVHLALGLRHISRVDLIVDRAGNPWFLEVNVLPGLTETSLVPQGLLAAGHDLGLTYSALAENAIRSETAALSS